MWRTIWKKWGLPQLRSSGLRLLSMLNTLSTPISIRSCGNSNLSLYPPSHTSLSCLQHLIPAAHMLHNMLAMPKRHMAYLEQIFVHCADHVVPNAQPPHVAHPIERKVEVLMIGPRHQQNPILGVLKRPLPARDTKSSRDASNSVLNPNSDIRHPVPHI